jgi:signal transduction histidine kinase
LWPLRGILAEAFYGGQPIILADAHDPNDPRATAFRNFVLEQTGTSLSPHVVTFMCVPIRAHNKSVGIIALHHDRPNAYSTAHAELAYAIAQQAGLAIENTRLHTQSVQAAAAAERSRLARDLHDSVSQAIFGISLGAKSMERLAVDDPSRVLEPLPYVINLANAALTEMRALIFELRPESLEQEGLLSALQKQSAAMSARHNLRVVEQFTAREPAISLNIKEALYRIAMESMHNIVKYARAQTVTLSLHEDSDSVRLEVRDDGIGFEPDQVPAGHFGLKSMRERVAELNGRIDIESSSGGGTRIAVQISKQHASRPALSFNIATA